MTPPGRTRVAADPYLSSDAPWHVTAEEQSQVSALSPPFSRAVRAGRPEELW